MGKQSHIERTANEPREAALHTLTIAHIEQVSPTVRVIRLAIPPDDSITFLPGQWVDLHPPPEAQVSRAGGFTITSSPTLALASSSSNLEHDLPSKEVATKREPPYIELAIQSSPHNPPAAYLFQSPAKLLHTPVQVRIGGSFVFPPPFLRHTTTTTPTTTTPTTNPPTTHTTTPTPTPAPIRKIILVAGGMGINPLMSILSRIGEGGGGPQGSERGEPAAADGSQAEEGAREGGGVEGLEGGGAEGVEGVEVRVLYGVKDPGLGTGNGNGNGNGNGGKILFLERMAGLFASGRVRGGVRLFVTGGVGGADSGGGGGGGGVSASGGVGDGWWGLGVEVSDRGVRVPCLRRRMTVEDVEEAVGEEKGAAVVYVCGVPGMTDGFVQALVAPEGFGMDPKRVLFEKWW